MLRTVSIVLFLGSLLVPVPLSAQSVTRVIDGDTYELSDGRRVRLIGVDTPEKHPSAKLERDAARSGRDQHVIRGLGAAASRYAERLVLGRRVRLAFDQANAANGHKDRYGRTLAYVYVINEGQDEFMVNRRLIEDGFANAYTSYPFRYKDDFLRAQREAREAGRGLWGRGGLDEPAPRKGGASFRNDGVDRDCSDFSSQREAQAFFVAAGPGDPHRLDRDGDGIVCEGLERR